MWFYKVLIVKVDKSKSFDSWRVMNKSQKKKKIIKVGLWRKKISSPYPILFSLQWCFQKNWEVIIINLKLYNSNLSCWWKTSDKCMVLMKFI